ncbi:MFS transporter [Streptomyces sp. NPDC018045]|uniref:MFS transporter n=1 Tax=Streptomyces sp. NPDC018045 TaxID=3365037 RepID=UPI00378C5170
MPGEPGPPAGSGRGGPVSPGLWRDADFRRLWAGQTASQFGERTGQVVLPLIAVLALDAGATELGALRALEQAPVLLLSLLAGAWVDRRRARDVMMAADLGRALALAVLPCAYLLGVLGFPTLVAVALLVGVLSVFFDVAYQASLVRLVRRDQLTQGNSALEGSRSAAQIGGPALGGALVSLLSAPVAAAAGACCFALSYLSVRRIRRPESMSEGADSDATAPRVGTTNVAECPPTEDDHAANADDPATGRHATNADGPAAGVAARGQPSHLWQRIGAGLRFVAGDASLRAVGLASAAFQFSFAALMTVYLLFLPRELHLSGTGVGLALAATGPGAVAGSLLAGWLPRRYGYGVVLVAAAVLADGVLLCVPALHGSTAATVVLLMGINFLFGTFSQLVNVTVMAVRQAVTPVPLQARVVATINCAGLGLAPLGSLLGGRLADQWGLRAALLVTAAGLSLSPLVMCLSPLARLGKSLPGEHSRLYEYE